MRPLLDGNVLIALLDSDHLHHSRAMAWLDENIQSGWASCPLTENGCIRIMSQPGYPNPLPAGAIAERLAAATATSRHVFWPDAVSILDSGRIAWNAVIGSRQVTDIYLLALVEDRKAIPPSAWRYPSIWLRRSSSSAQAPDQAPSKAFSHWQVRSM